MTHFPTDFDSIWHRVEAINPVKYAKTRNFTDGAVTYLSPYLTHGVITPHDVMHHVLEKYTFPQCEKLIQELAWREFFQLVWRVQGDTIFSDLRFPQSPVASHGLPQCIPDATTGVAALDTALTQLVKTGYMHNHARMWLASVVCNRGQYHWQTPAKWLYYHLLDGDLASNTLSWQWCAGAFASKKYWANQENVNRYTKTQQQHTIIDYSYDQLPDLPIPPALHPTTEVNLQTSLPQSEVSSVTGEVLLYHPWGLDPRWHAQSPAQRVLVLEPSRFSAWPMSGKRMKFILDLAQEIAGLQVFVGELRQLTGIGNAHITYQKHPAVSHWDHFLRSAHAEDPRTLFAPNVKYYKSFFAYWKACQKTDRFADMSKC